MTDTGMFSHHRRRIAEMKAAEQVRADSLRHMRSAGGQPFSVSTMLATRAAQFRGEDGQRQVERVAAALLPKGGH
jgi:hypothetical protein